LWLLDAPHAGRKLGGVLIETVAAGAKRLAVIGVGLNVQPMQATEVGTGFASLQEIDAQVEAPAVLHRLALPLVQAIRRFEAEGFAGFVAAYSRRDLLLGQPVRTTQQGVAEGVAEGVDERGALQVRTPAGLVAVTSGEVSVRLGADGGAG
jgi:BirA family biotin operon repressor/biotin-[acetyl-CoA-carboxylase] ligase